MNKLWAPWRKTYIRPPKGTKQKGCLFCRVQKQKNDKSNLIVRRSRHSFAILNLYPYNNAHIMIVPNRHAKALSELTDAEKLDWLELYDDLIAALSKLFHPDGFNAGMNLGRPAGAGIPDHIHLHIVPRWNGDTNFMPVLGHTKVISESLQSVYETLTKYFKKR